MSVFYKDYTDLDETYLDTAEQAANAAISAQKQSETILEAINNSGSVNIKNITGLSDALALKLSKTETINGGTY
jgi:hypothetical protein